MKVCLIYTRVSTEEQAKEGYSLATQKKACYNLAKKLKYRVLGVYSDEGRSATIADRPQFQEMIDRCEEEKIDAILVYHTDRFARNELDHAFYKDRLAKKGVKLLSVSQPMIDESPEGKLLDGMLANINAYYSRDLGRKTKKGLNKKFEEGWWPGWAPLGYKNVRDPKNPNRKIVIPDLKIAPIIKKAFKLYSTGNYSIWKLIKMLHKEGLRTRTGTPIAHSTMHNTLTNPFYYGEMHWNNQIKRRKHKPLIDKRMFGLCQYIAEKHRNFLIRERKYDFLLRGFVFCKLHNRRLVAEKHKINSKKRNNEIAYYHCCERGGCAQSYVETGKLEKQVENQFKKLQFTQEFIDAVAKKTKEFFENAKEEIAKEKKALIRSRTNLEIKRNKLEDMLLDDTIDRKTFKRRHTELQAKIDNLQEEIDKLEQKRKLDVNLIDEVLGLTRNIYQTYKDAPQFLKRHYLRFFFEKMYVEDKKLAKVAPSPLFATLIEEQKVILSRGLLRGLDSNQ